MLHNESPLQVLFRAPAQAEVYALRSPANIEGGLDAKLPPLAAFLRWQARCFTDTCTLAQARKAQALFGAGAGPGLAAGADVGGCEPFIREGQLCIERVGEQAQLSVIGASEAQPPFLVLRARPPTPAEAERADLSSEQPRCPCDAFVEVSQKLLLVSSTAVLACSAEAGACGPSGDGGSSGDGNAAAGGAAALFALRWSADA